ncbi:MAG: TatD family hydrolase [Deinococcales bacterium]
MIDTHCHLDYCHELEQAYDPSLSAIISIGTTLERCRNTLKLAERFDNVYAAVGIHPNDALEAEDAKIRAEIEAMAQHPKVVAIGESGFDAYWDSVALDIQEKSFRWQAELAARLAKPLILHVRDKQNQEIASLKTKTLIEELGYDRGILHCCNGHEALVQSGLNLGWYVSFAGNVSYPKATDIHAIAKALPQDRILLETDSPFLAPVPKRGQKNIPAYVRYTAEALAKLRGESLAEVEAYTDQNAKKVYKLSL